MTEQFYYEMECVVCDTVVKLICNYEDDEPIHCPMCGTEAEVTYLGDSDAYT